jgi:hypothetical protein
MRILKSRLPHRGIRSATSTTFDFGASFPFTFVSAYRLPVYASQWPLPDTTQDSVPGCWLGFTRATISGCCIPCACKAQSSSNRTCRFPASGSRTRQHAFAHERSYAVHPIYRAGPCCPGVHQSNILHITANATTWAVIRFPDHPPGTSFASACGAFCSSCTHYRSFLGLPQSPVLCHFQHLS